MIIVKEHSIKGSDNKQISIDITCNEKIENAPLIIFIHGFKGFKDWGAHHLVASYFAQHNYRYLKFNFSHSGVTPEKPNEVSDLESFSTNTISKEMLDLDLVIQYAIENLNVKTVFLIGHSRGGGLGILQSAFDPRVKGLITWSSIADFSSLWGKSREVEWKKEGSIDVVNARTKEKMPLKVVLLNDFEANIEKLNIVNHAKTINIPWLIIQGDDDVNVPMATAQQLADANPASRLIKIDGANHVYGASHPYLNETLPPQLFQVREKSIDFLSRLV